ncbi:hypothetical protein AcV5_002751 [Taiwanofungus camphoratus]|nr:hypothetical protein AcV5_002751 [Antrodia cinnamomea]
MQPCFRRLYATLPEAAAVARTSSTPRAVRLRRLRFRQHKHVVLPIESDATPEGLTPTEFARYQRAIAKGDMLDERGRNLTEAEWLDRLNSRRSRIRGIREMLNEKGEKEARVVGQRVYLPNIIFRLVRNHTPPGQPYNPYEATFRIPQSVTKTDVRSYLLAVYGVKTTYIRTDNYFSPVTRSPYTFSWTERKKHKTYKRAVVGLVHPFYYPRAIEDMNGKEREERLKWVEEAFAVKQIEDGQKIIQLRVTKSGSPGWKWRTGSTAQRGNILRLIAERRATRERAILDAKNRMRESRQNEEAAV